jgi:hypothetical protein
VASDESLLTLLASHRGTRDGGVKLAGLRLRASEMIPSFPSLRPSSIASSDKSLTERVDSVALLSEAPLTALLGDTPTEVTCQLSARGITVHATGFGQVFISADGHRLTWRPADDVARKRPELILGPGLVLALAVQGTFCLHASAVLTHEGAVLFAGDSDAGKSTLAARLSAKHGFQRLSDDITPFTADGTGCFVLPHFPQLKLPPESQHPAEAPQRYPIARFYLLTECGTEAPVREEPISPSVAALSVCSHAVAARLFPERLMTGLLHASTVLVENVTVRHLLYPKRPGSIADVARLLSTP